MKTEIMTLKFLKDHNACESGIAFATINNLLGLPLEHLISAKGDFNNFKGWLEYLPTLTFDSYGNRVKAIYPSGETTTWEYDSHGNKVKEVYPLGGTTTWEYDSHGNMVKAIYPSGKTYTWEYDSHGNKVKQVDPSGGTYTREYDYHVNNQLKEVRRNNEVILSIPLYISE